MTDPPQWTHTRTLRQGKGDGVGKMVVGIRLSEDVLAALRNGERCSLMVEQGETSLCVGNSVYRLDKRALATDRESRQVYRRVAGSSDQLRFLGTQRSMYALTGRTSTGGITSTATASVSDGGGGGASTATTSALSATQRQRNQRRQIYENRRMRMMDRAPTTGEAEALTPQQMAARSAVPARASPRHPAANHEAAGTKASLAAASSARSAAANTSVPPPPKRPTVSLRSRLLHLLALGPSDANALQNRLGERPESIMIDLRALADREGSVYYLRAECFREVKPHEWDYSDEERRQVIDQASRIFDQLGLPADARERVMLLQPADRPSGWERTGSLRERVIHALAPAPMEFKRAQELSGSTEDDAFGDMLREVGRFNGSAWTLKDGSYREIRVADWPGWTPAERRQVAATMRATFEAQQLPTSDEAWRLLDAFPVTPPPPVEASPPYIAPTIATTITAAVVEPPLIHIEAPTASTASTSRDKAPTITAPPVPATKPTKAKRGTRDATAAPSTAAKPRERKRKETAPPASAKPSAPPALIEPTIASTSSAVASNISAKIATAATTTAPKPPLEQAKRPTASKDTTNVAGVRKKKSREVPTVDTAKSAASKPREKRRSLLSSGPETSHRQHGTVYLMDVDEPPTSTAAQEKAKQKRATKATVERKTRLAPPNDTSEPEQHASPAVVPHSGSDNDADSVDEMFDNEAADVAREMVIEHNRSGAGQRIHLPTRLTEHPPQIATRSDYDQLYKLYRKAHREHRRLYKRLVQDNSMVEQVDRAWREETDPTRKEEIGQWLDKMVALNEHSSGQLRLKRYQFVRDWLAKTGELLQRALHDNGW